MEITKEWLELISKDWCDVPSDYKEIGIGRYCQYPVKFKYGVADCGESTGSWLGWIYYENYDLGMYVCDRHQAIVEAAII